MKPVHQFVIPALLASACSFSLPSMAQEPEIIYDETVSEGQASAREDSIENALLFVQGPVEIADGAITLQIPDSFKYLGAEQSKLVLLELWDNPPSAAEDVLGLIFHVEAGLYDDDLTYVVSYETIGYVSDADADGIDLLDMAAFNAGYRYADFDPDTDEVADWSVGGLIDGKVKEQVVGVLKKVLVVAGISVVSLIAIVTVVVILIRRKGGAS